MFRKADPLVILFLTLLAAAEAAGHLAPASLEMSFSWVCFLLPFTSHLLPITHLDTSLGLGEEL